MGANSSLRQMYIIFNFFFNISGQQACVLYIVLVLKGHIKTLYLQS